jgi:[lysine-biosynthesis-protein LysW]--L-2-aminoadipate ligase
MTTIGVLCERVRVEEKQVLAALAEVGLFAAACSPADAPLPIGLLPPRPNPPRPSESPIALLPVAPALFVDRCRHRATAAAMLTAYRALGVATIDAGLAATGTRLAAATALSAAGLPRPETRLVGSPAAALLALEELGYPATLLPLTAGADSTLLLDVDTAEAVFEHRSVLGSAHDALALIQAGTTLRSDAAALATVIVVDGHAVAVTATDDSLSLSPIAIELAESAACALGAAIVGIDVATGPAGPIVWDARPVPDFRHATLLGATSVAASLAASIAARVGPVLGGIAAGERTAILAAPPAQTLWSTNGREVGDGAALIA